MNLNKMHIMINQYVVKSKMEKVAINLCLDIFPELPTKNCYDPYEENGYFSAYNLMCPDIDFTDEFEYIKFLESNTNDDCFIERSVERYRQLMCIYLILK